MMSGLVAPLALLSGRHGSLLTGPVPTTWHGRSAGTEPRQETWWYYVAAKHATVRRILSQITPSDPVRRSALLCAVMTHAFSSVDRLSTQGSPQILFQRFMLVTWPPVFSPNTPLTPHNSNIRRDGAPAAVEKTTRFFSAWCNIKILSYQ